MERNLLNERFITIEKLADGELSHKLPGLTVKFAGASQHWNCPVFGTAVFFCRDISGRSVGCFNTSRRMLYGFRSEG